MKRSQEFRIERRRFSFWLAVAAGTHLLVLLSALAYQHFLGSSPNPPKIVNVSLVSLPGPGGASLPAGEGEPGPASSETVPRESPDAAPEAVKTVEPEPVAVPVKKTVSKPAKQKIPEKPVKEKLPARSEPVLKTPEKPADIGKALEKLKQSVDRKSAASGPAKQDNLGSALARLQQKVSSQGSGKGTGGGGSAAGSGTGRGGGGKADPYKVRIASIIQKNWEFSSQMLQNSYGMEVKVHIFILDDGTISEITFDRRAPSAYLNNSVKRALEKSSPLPALPSDYGSGGISIGFVFTPEGIDM
ncbi:MAG: TonB C-terminal domain-containing protein [Chlorobium sp.]|uniref:TonB C-terminal domain-containing protein n=1 Tax=Chlorobium sp. TaxID=1095 RepID=UPI0025BA0BA7|nr:TonB C-terminal domain-containing protein [Chlorobium sp.]MCF8382147.1 TonB C-terminal domain-containing protein [Chlorobium sp.]